MSIKLVTLLVHPAPYLLHLADGDAALEHVAPRGVDVFHDELDALEGAWLSER